MGFRAGLFKHRALDFEVGNLVFVDFIGAGGKAVNGAKGRVAFVGESQRVRGHVVGVHLDEPVGVPGDDDSALMPHVPHGHAVFAQGEAVRHQAEEFAVGGIGLGRTGSCGSGGFMTARAASAGMNHQSSAALFCGKVSKSYKPSKFSRLTVKAGSFEHLSLIHI